LLSDVAKVGGQEVGLKLVMEIAILINNQ
jgi:hypothetical protein